VVLVMLRPAEAALVADVLAARLAESPPPLELVAGHDPDAAARDRLRRAAARRLLTDEQHAAAHTAPSAVEPGPKRA
jgi:hypothetical protein